MTLLDTSNDSGKEILNQDYLVDAPMAQNWLVNHNFANQRKIRAWHVKRLAGEMQNDRFIQGTQIHFALFDRKLYLVNGQHTLSAICLSNLPQRLSVLVTSVKSDRDVAELYYRHDTHLTRTLKDAFSATGLAEEFGITLTQLSIISSASIYLEGLRGGLTKSQLTTMSNDRKFEITRDYKDEALLALAVFDGALNKSYFRRRTTMACALLTAQHDMHHQFWRGLVVDDGLRKGSPQKTLLDYLRDTVIPGGQFSGARRRSVPEHMIMKGISHAWNAFIANTDLTIIKPRFDMEEATFNQIETIRVL